MGGNGEAKGKSALEQEMEAMEQEEQEILEQMSEKNGATEADAEQESEPAGEPADDGGTDKKTYWDKKKKKKKKKNQDVSCWTFLFIMVALVAFGIGTGLAIVYYRKAADAATQAAAQLPEKLGSGAQIVLTDKNVDAKTAGKTVFIKFMAPWCGHCQRLAPAWKHLMAEFNTREWNKGALIAKVDCDGAGKTLCNTYGVTGFPTLMYGGMDDLQKYEGERSFGNLKTFAAKEIRPRCSVFNMAMCDGEQKSRIEKYQSKTDEEIKESIEAKQADITKIEEDFNIATDKIQTTYTELQKASETFVEDTKTMEYKMLRAVRRSRSRASN